jgi:hypothetical protein
MEEGGTLPGKGIRHSPESTVALLRNNLLENYPVEGDYLTITKEIVQNADDAGATRLHLGWLRGIEDADHPLLRGPAFIAVNNAALEPKHATAIRTMGIGSKSFDHDSIGRFGLGIKSVFHLCEAFLYLSSDASQDDILNPWSGVALEDSLRPEWDALTDRDRQSMRSCLRPFQLGESWFCLWIPLRREAHAPDSAIAIAKNRPGDEYPNGDGFFPSSVGMQLAHLLPLLASLRELTVWLPSTQGPLARAVAVTLADGCLRRKYKLLIAGEGPSALHGHVEVVDFRSGTQRQVAYAGWEEMSDAARLRDLRGSSVWPDDHEYGSTESRGVDAPLPHAAAYFMSEDPPSAGAFDARWNVFLPLREGVGQPVPLHGQSVTLYLHGCFCIDAGRSRVDFPKKELSGLPGNERELRLVWNRTLADEAVLPLVLPALDEYRAHANLTDAQVAPMTEALLGSRVISDHRSVITSTYRWLRVTGVRPDASAWKLHKTHAPYYAIPSPPSGDREWVHQLLPALAEGSEIDVVYEGDPRISAGVPSPWTSELARSALDLNVSAMYVDESLDPSRLDYASKLVASTIGPALREDVVVRTRLIAAAQKLLRHAGPGADDDVVKALMGFLLIAAKDSILPVPIPTEATRASFDARAETLLLATRDVVVVPSHYIDAVETPTSMMSIADGARAIEMADAGTEPFTDGDARLLNAVTAAVLRAVPSGDLPDLVARCEDLPAAAALECSSGDLVRWTLRQLFDRGAEGIVCSARALSPPASMNYLVEAAPEAAVYVVTSDILEALGSAGVMAPADVLERAVVSKVLRSGPRLAPPKGRVGLLTWILQEGLRGMGYLLHGRVDADDGPMYAVGSAPPAVWVSILRRTLAAREDEWRLLPSVLTRELSERQLVNLGVSGVDAETAVLVLSDLNDDALRELVFTAEERDTLLRDIGDTGLLPRLPIHVTTDGRVVSIDHSAYLATGDLPLPSALDEDAVLIQPHTDPALRLIQEGFIRPLTVDAALDALLTRSAKLDTPPPWGQIADLLDQGGPNALPEALVDRLKQTPWLPTTGAHPVAPQRVIQLPRLDPLLRHDEISSANWEDTRLPRDLDRPLLDHPAYPKIKDLFPDVGTAVSMLAEALATSPRFLLGSISIGDAADAKWWDDFLRAMRAIPVSALPAAPLLTAVFDSTRGHSAARGFATTLAHPVDADRKVAIINALVESHVGAPKADTQSLVNVHRLYLEATARDSLLRSVLPRVSLLSEAGTWESPARLCFDGEGVAPRHRLHRSLRTACESMQADVSSLRSRHTPSTAGAGGRDPADLYSQIDDGTKQLEEYVRGWEGRVPAAALGAFVSLLGVDVKSLAAEILGGINRSVEKTRELFDWPELHRADHRVQGWDWPIGKCVDSVDYMFSVVDKESHGAQSLLGSTFSASLADEDSLETLLVDDRVQLYSAEDGDGKRLALYQVSLRRVDVDAMSERRRLDLLRDTAGRILERACKRRPPNLHEAWDDLGQADQHDISIAQDLILEHAFFYLRQINVHTHEDFVDAFRESDRARTLRAEEKRVARVRRDANERDRLLAEEAIEAAKARLRRSIVESPQGQRSILRSVRRKVRDHYQYSSNRVLFELFQNADDACRELAWMEADTSRDADRFVVGYDNRSLDIVHWGRCINQMGPHGMDGDKHGFSRDLEKMLVLSGSDKESVSADTPVTGRFGLGFKTAFLVTDSPRILSGRLAFRVVGGVYPEILHADERSALEDVARAASAASTQPSSATVLRLPVKDEDVAWRAVDRFRALTPMLVVFARSIRRCVVPRPGGAPAEAQWQPTHIVDGVSCGLLSVNADDDLPPRAILVGPPGTRDGLLFALDARGFTQFPPNVPSIWVTAPTQEETHLGFLINGDFAVDIGRAQLAKHATVNDRRGDQLGRSVGEHLCSLHALASEEWPRFTSLTGIAPDTDPEDVWSSLWGLCAQDLGKRVPQAADTPAVDLARRILWGSEDAGMRRLINNVEAMPTGLVGSYKVLTRLDSVRWVAGGGLDDPDVFALVAEWPSFQEHVAPASIVSESKAWQALRSLGVPLPRHRVVDLDDAISWAASQTKRVDPELAEALGRVVTPDFLATDPPGRVDLQRVLRSLKFLSEEGSYRHPAALLTGVVDEEDMRVEDALLTELAPRDRLLARQYGPHGVAFYRACRYQQQTDVSQEDVLQWVLDTRDAGQLDVQGLNRYLYEGRHRSWLFEQLPGHGLHGLGERAERLIQAHMGLPVHATDSTQEDATVRVGDPVAGLDAIYDWWMDRGGQWVSKYDADVYPDGGLGLTVENADSQDAPVKTRWLTLLLLGAFQTMGFASPQAHRSALHERASWIQALIDAPDDVNEWREAYGEYLDRYQEYIERGIAELPFYRWSTTFLTGVQFRHWLDSYVDAFLAVDRMERFTLDEILRPRTSSHFQGGGPDAPPIDAALGIGATFVMRELVRHGVLANKRAYRYCYVPSRSVLEFLDLLGVPTASLRSEPRTAQSEAIHEFLVSRMGKERATFDLSFDLPFRAIAQDTNLKRSFLDITSEHA